MIKFKYYKESKDIPKYKDMECYFMAPLMGVFNEKSNYYYLLKYSEGNFWIMVYDRSMMSMMNSGCDCKGQISPYQADEYYMDTRKEVLDFLCKCGFTERSYNHDKVKKRLKKMKKKYERDNS